MSDNEVGSLVQGEQRESVLDCDRTRGSDRRSAMHGEERESMLERDRVLFSER